MMKFLHSTPRVSNEQANEVFRQFAWSLGGALKSAKSSRAKPQKPSQSRKRPVALAAKRVPKRASN